MIYGVNKDSPTSRVWLKLGSWGINAVNKNRHIFIDGFAQAKYNTNNINFARTKCDGEDDSFARTKR